MPPKHIAINPNRCETCHHKQTPEGGWCYMFRTEPDDVCLRHTARHEEWKQARREMEKLIASLKNAT